MSGKFFFLGLGAALSGSVLLLFTTGILPTLTSLWPGLFLLIGTYLLYRGYIIRSSEGAIFMGVFFLLFGVVLVLLNTVMSWAVLERLWPVFLTVLALALLFYGLQKKSDARIIYVTPALVLIGLSLLFLLFSLDLIEMSFAKFVTRWWPLAIVALGLTVMLHNALKKTSD